MRKSAQNIKAVFVPADMTEMSTCVSRDNSLTVLRYSLDLARVRKQNGIPYERFRSASLSLAFKALDDDACRKFYSWMVDRQPHSFSLISDAVYGPGGRLLSWDSAMVAEGCVVDIDETFRSHHDSPDEVHQMSVSLNIILSNVRFLGDNEEIELQITY